MKNGLKCPNCNHYLDLPDQVKSWDEDFGNEARGEALFNIYCLKCGEGGYILSLGGYDKAEEVVFEDDSTIPVNPKKSIN